MLHAMEFNAKENDNFVIKVKSTEIIDGKSYIEKKRNGRRRRKELKLFFPFSKWLPWATSLKVTFPEIVSYF